MLLTLQSNGLIKSSRSDGEITEEIIEAIAQANPVGANTPIDVKLDLVGLQTAEPWLLLILW